jgi:hypothetical protein
MYSRFSRSQTSWGDPVPPAVHASMLALWSRLWKSLPPLRFWTDAGRLTYRTSSHQR